MDSATLRRAMLPFYSTKTGGTGLGLAIAPVGGYLAITGVWSDPWWLLIALTLGVMSWSGGFDVLYALPDIEFDRAQELHSIPASVGVSRAIGETMVVAIAAGAVGGGLFSLNPLQPGQTMTAAMAALGFGSDQVAGDNLAFQSLYFVGLLLFIMTFVLNLVSDRLVSKVREVY